VIENRTIPYSYTFNVQSYSKKLEPINNPINWQPISYLVEDGAEVKKGDLVVQFDISEAEFSLKEKVLDLAIIENDLESKLEDIDNQENKMLETLTSLKEDLLIKKATLDKYNSIPREEDLILAEGRLRIARMNLEAAESSLEKASSRLEKKMISPQEYEQARFDFMEKKALFDFATADYDLENQSAPKSSIEKITLEIANTELEMEKLQREIEDYKIIAKIQRENAGTRKTLIENRIDDIKADISKSSIFSPFDGYANINYAYDVKIAEGSKLSKSYLIMNIADVSSLAFKGPIPEKLRKFYQEGDSVSIKTFGQADQVIQGKIKSISNLARDLAEKDKTTWDDVGKKYGIKVYDVVIEINKSEPFLKPGINGVATIQSSESFSGPAVPIKYLLNRNGEFFLTYQGQEKKVTGSLNDGWFLIDDSNWTGLEIDEGSLMLEEETNIKIESKPSDPIRSNMLTVSGEMKPVHSIDIIANDIFWRSKISWLIPEESTVKKGDVVAKIGNEDMQEQLNKAKTRLKSAEGDMEEAEKNSVIQKRESDFRLKRALNELRIAEIEVENAKGGIDLTSYLQSKLNVQKAEIELTKIQQEVDNEKDKKLTAKSPLEIKKLAQQLRKAQLELEKSRINLTKIESGATEVQRSQVDLNLLKKQVDKEITERSAILEEVRSRINLKNKERNVFWNQRHLNRLLKQKDNMTLIAPSNGIIQYGTTWVKGGIGKFAEGTEVWPRSTVLRLPDYSEMYLSVKIPEIYYPQIHTGLQVDIEIPSMVNMMVKGYIDKIDIIFQNKAKQENNSGLYSSHEPLGEVEFTVQIRIMESKIKIKPGAVGIVYFPFSKEDSSE
jgi:multidrug resistance efflux pump